MKKIRYYLIKLQNLLTPLFLPAPVIVANGDDNSIASVFIERTMIELVWLAFIEKTFRSPSRFIVSVDGLIPKNTSVIIIFFDAMIVLIIGI